MSDADKQPPDKPSDEAVRPLDVGDGSAVGTGVAPASGGGGLNTSQGMAPNPYTFGMYSPWFTAFHGKMVPVSGTPNHGAMQGVPAKAKGSVKKLSAPGRRRG